MKYEDILQYYDYLSRLAASKCDSVTDAEDLVSETILAALVYTHGGNTIEYPKTWLTSTMMNKYNSMLREKYRIGAVVCIDSIDSISDDCMAEMLYTESEEASFVRKELNYLARISRQVLIRYYYNGESVSSIAKSLGIPEGTVKSRLALGREQMKKGLTEMESRSNYLPGKLMLSWSGYLGMNGEPLNIIEDDLIAQNLLILAYEKPLTVSELSKRIGIPAAYVEPILDRLTDKELISKTPANRFYTDFIIYRPEDYIKAFPIQQEFVQSNFERIWAVVESTVKRINSLECASVFSVRQKGKLERFVVMELLSLFFGDSQFICGRSPKRKDGGQWSASGNLYPAEYYSAEYERVKEYVAAGLRSHTVMIGDKASVKNRQAITLHEFDTKFLDNCSRYESMGLVNFYKEVIPFIWDVYSDDSIEESNVPNRIIELIPILESIGFLARENGELTVDIPVFSEENYKRILDLINEGVNSLLSTVGDSYKKYLTDNSDISVPHHIKNIPEFQRSFTLRCCINMLIVRTAYEKGLHLNNVDYCCPPVLLSYKKK